MDFKTGCHLAGLAAGFDKDAQALEGLLGLGFGFVEIGAPSKLQTCNNAQTVSSIITACRSHVILAFRDCRVCHTSAAAWQRPAESFQDTRAQVRAPCTSAVLRCPSSSHNHPHLDLIAALAPRHILTASRMRLQGCDQPLRLQQPRVGCGAGKSDRLQEEPAAPAGKSARPRARPGRCQSGQEQAE